MSTSKTTEISWISTEPNINEANVIIYYNLSIELYAKTLLDREKIYSMRYLKNRNIDASRVDEIVAYQTLHVKTYGRYDYDSMIVFGRVKESSYLILDGQHRLCSCVYLTNQESIKLNLCFYTFDTPRELHEKYVIVNRAEPVGNMCLSFDQEDRKVFELVENIISLRYPNCIRGTKKYRNYMRIGLIPNALYTSRRLLERFNDLRQTIEHRANTIANVLISYNDNDFKRLIQGQPKKLRTMYGSDTTTTITEKNIQYCEQNGSFYMGFVHESRFGVFIEKAVEADSNIIMIDI